MELYIVYGVSYLDGSDGLEPAKVYSLYGVFDQRDLAEKIVRDKTRANEQNDSGEIILVKQGILNRPTDEFYEDC